MHYYKKVIGDYRRRTSGLSLLEHGCYQQLIDEYYLDEKPFPDNLKLLCKKIGARTEEEKECVQDILELYFELTPDGWRHHHCDEVIDAYQKGADINRVNGMKGGRPKKTHSVLNENPNETETKGNHRTTNQGTKEPESSKKYSDDDLKLAQFIWVRILKINPNHKQPNLEKWADEIRVTREQDKRTHKDLQNAFIWANADKFWCKNILSPSALRKHFDKLTINASEPVKGKIQLPTDDNELWGFARTHGLPDPQSKSFFEYRKFLQRFVDEYGILEDGEMTKKPDWLLMPPENSDLNGWVKKHKYPECPDNITSITDYRNQVLKPAIESRFRYSIK